MSRKSWYSIMAVLVIAATALSACATPATPAPTAMPAPTTAPAATAAPAATTAPAFAVGVVLPTKNEPRWIQDETRFNDAFKAAGYTVQILFSEAIPPRKRPTLSPSSARASKS